VTIAKDDRSVSTPVEIAADVAAETLHLLLDEDDITNCPHCSNVSLTEWLGARDAEVLRDILSKITGPEGPTFTAPHQGFTADRREGDE
jgi:hypothetical protein